LHAAHAGVAAHAVRPDARARQRRGARPARRRRAAGRARARRHRARPARARRSRHLPRGRGAGARRPPAPARLPPDPQGQVRPPGPVAVLTELRVQDLGIIADLSLVVGPGMTAITGETGAGKTLLVEALELLVGG